MGLDSVLGSVTRRCEGGSNRNVAGWCVGGATLGCGTEMGAGRLAWAGVFMPGTGVFEGVRGWPVCTCRKLDGMNGMICAMRSLGFGMLMGVL